MTCLLGFLAQVCFGRFTIFDNFEAKYLPQDFNLTNKVGNDSIAQKWENYKQT